jgi:hypothetical protein
MQEDNDRNNSQQRGSLYDHDSLNLLHFYKLIEDNQNFVNRIEIAREYYVRGQALHSEVDACERLDCLFVSHNELNLQI